MNFRSFLKIIQIPFHNHRENKLKIVFEEVENFFLTRGFYLILRNLKKIEIIFGAKH